MKFSHDWGTNLIKTDQWYIGPVKDWETDLYGYELHSGVGDFIYNNCRMIIETEDRSEWAYQLMEYCFDLLLWRMRWPVPIQLQILENRQCKTRFCSWVQKIRKNINKKANERRVTRGKPKKQITVKFRSWGDMTRDCYIAAFACAVYLNWVQFIEIISIPWYLYRPNTWAWHRYLKDPTEKNLNRYDFWESLSPNPSKEFAQVLKYMRRWAVLNRKIN